MLNKRAELVETVNNIWRREHKALNVICHIAIYLYQLTFFLWNRP
jgi:hypothetical protein